MTPFDTPPAPAPDWFRARVRTAAQVVQGFIFALVARWLAKRAGIDISDWADEVRQLVDIVALAGSTVLWMWITTTLERWLPWLDRVFVLRGAPTYPGREPLSRPRLRRRPTLD